MADYFFLVPIALFLLVGVVSPGPSFVLVAQTAMARSRKHGMAAALGMGAGACLFAAAASLGLLVLLEAVPWLYLGLKVAGGLFLCYLAMQLWRHAGRDVTQSEQEQVQNTGLWRAFFSGLMTQLSNPKTAIVFASAFAAFLPKEAPAGTFALICLMAFAIDALWYLLVASVLSTPSAQRFYSRSRITLTRTASGVMGAMGVKLITSDL